MKLKDRKIGKYVRFHHKNNKEHKYRGIIIDEVAELNKKKKYSHRLQKIIWCQEKNNEKSKWKDSKLRVSVRVCYYVEANKKDIVFGQFCTTTEPDVIGKLFRRANKKGFFKPMKTKQMKKEIDKHIK